MEVDGLNAWFLALWDLDKRKLYSLWLPDTGGFFLLSARRIDAQMEHNDFKHQKRKFPDVITTFTGFEGAYLYPSLGSHHFVLYPDEEKESPDEKPGME